MNKIYLIKYGPHTYALGYHLRAVIFSLEDRCLQDVYAIDVR